MSTGDAEEQPKVYAVRLTERAQVDIAEARRRMADLTEEGTADEWEAALVEAISKLATFPNGYPAIPEARRFPRLTVRQMLYRRTSVANAAHRVVFRVQEEGDDGPVVFIIHVRHSARRPISASEAAELREGITP